MPNKNKALGKALEKKVASLGGGKVQPLSGILPDYPNDVDLGKTLVECKVRSTTLNATGEKYITINLDWLHKVEQNATKKGFDLGIVAVRPKRSRRVYALLDLNALLDLLSFKNASLDTKTCEVVQ